MNVITDRQLLGLLRQQGTARIWVGGQPYIFQAIEREDGSGQRFNLYCTHEKTHEKKAFFVKIAS